MRTQDESALRERVTALLSEGCDPLVAKTWENPVSVYFEADHLDRERDSLFSSLPLVIGRGDQLAEPHDFFVHEHTGRSLIVTRGPDGKVRAFHNVCRHRGAKVEWEPCGSRRRFTCPYHAWSYNGEGTLVGIPNEEGFEGMNRDAHNLVPVAVAEHLGFIWVDFSAPPNEEVDIAGFLGPIGEELAGFGIQHHRHDIHEVLREPFNWKLVVDGFLETYHLRFLHRSTIGPHIRSNFALVDTYGRHLRMVGVRQSLDDWMRGDHSEPFLAHTAIIYLLFPNTVLVWQGDHFEAWTSWPGADGAASTVAEARLLAPRPLDGADRERWDKNWQILMRTVLDEDFVASRSMQQNYAANAQSHAVFGRQEGALQHFHKTLRSELVTAGAATETT